VDIDELRSLLTEEVIKRELIDGDEARSAAAFLKKMQRRLNTKRNGSGDDEQEAEGASVVSMPKISANEVGSAPLANEGLVAPAPASKPQSQ
jgi:hypothetical protein